MSGANDKTGVGAGSAEWGTPPELFARLERRFRFDYDAFASHENALCARYSTIDGTFGRPIADNRFRHDQVSEADGLCYDWSGLRVFLNPPYTNGLIGQCVEKAYNERHSAALIAALLPAATETQWFQRFVLPHCHIDWLSRRVRYIHPMTRCINRKGEECKHQLGAPCDGPPGGSVIAVWKTDLI